MSENNFITEGEKVRDLIFTWTYADFLRVTDLNDNASSQKEWLQLIAVIKKNWCEQIDGDILETILEAYADEFGGEK